MKFRKLEITKTTERGRRNRLRVANLLKDPRNKVPRTTTHHSLHYWRDYLLAGTSDPEGIL